MIEFYMSNDHYDDMIKFSGIFKKSVNDFILDSIGLHLCEWGKNNTAFGKGSSITPHTSDIDIRVELPNDIEVKLQELSNYYNLSVFEVIQGLVENTVHYLNLNWTGHYGNEVLSLSDDEKVEELTKENDYQDDCWNDYFG